jgi:two-component system, cell cycle response regulator
MGGSDPPDSLSVTPAVPMTTPRLNDSGLPKVYDEHEGTETDQTAIIAPKSIKHGTHPTLLVIGGTSSGNAFRLDKARTLVGRARTADICLSDVGVSRIHCIVHSSAESGCFVEDQRSTNGTAVNGRNIMGLVRLAAGDRISVGPEAVLQFDYFDQAQQDLAKRLYDNATRDPLTRAYSRLHFGERLASEIAYAARHGEPLGVILLDVDHFKKVNDTYGHAGGDEVLRRVSAACAGVIRTGDVFARYGGEEFVVLARGQSKRELVQLAERLRTTVAGLVLRLGPTPCGVTASFGVAELGEVARPEANAEGFLALADARLYRAKATGRNRVVDS